MPSVYSSEYSTGTYTYTRVKVDYSGASATLYCQYSSTNSYTRGQDSNWVVKIDDAQGQQLASGSTGYVSFSGEQTDATIWSTTVTLPSTTSPTTLYIASTSTGSDHFLDFVGTVTIPTQGGTGPTGLTASNIVPSTEGFTADVSITSWNGGTPNFLGITAWTQGYVEPRLNQFDFSHNLTSTITVSNSSSYSGTLTIQPNTYYSLRASASNSLYQTNTDIGDFATLPAATTVSVSATTANSATIAYTTGADGGALTKAIEYSLDGGVTWQTGATVATGTATSGTYTITGLTAGTTYSIQTRTATTAGTTAGTTLSVTTPVSYKLYGSVNNETKQITKLYGSVNGQTKQIVKLYGSVNGVTKRIF